MLTPSWPHWGIWEVSLLASSVNRNWSDNNILLSIMGMSLPLDFLIVECRLQSLMLLIKSFTFILCKFNTKFLCTKGQSIWSTSTSIAWIFPWISFRPGQLKMFKKSLMSEDCILTNLLFPSPSMHTFCSSLVRAPELTPGKLTTPPSLLLLFLVSDDSDTGDTISSGVLVLNSMSMLQNLRVQPGTSLSVQRHLQNKLWLIVD